MKNFIHVGLLTRDEIVAVIIEALRMIPYYCQRQSPPPPPSLRALVKAKQQRPKTVFWFEELSTRTRHSFEEASELVGFRVGGAITAADSSLGKGEPAGLTLRMLIQQGADIVVVRSKTEGLGMHLAQCIQRTPADESWVRQDVSIIVAGAGTRDHPSQVLLDLVTIVAQRLGVRKQSQYINLETLFRRQDAEQYLTEQIGAILDNLKIAFVGDLLHSRVVHDWIKLGKLFSIHFTFIAPPVFQVEVFCRPEQCAAESELTLALKADVVYTIRTQLERLKEMMPSHEAEAVARSLMITPEFMERYEGFILDAQPIDGHAPTIDPCLWVHPKNLMLMESSIGIPTRMAILRLCEAGRHTEATPVLEEPRIRPVVLQEGDLNDHRQKLDSKYHDRDLFFTYVRNGTVIDRLRPGTASLVRRLGQKAGLFRGPRRQITIGEGVDSKALPGGKEIIQLHNRWPSFQLAATIGIIAPDVRFSFMRKDDEEKEYRRLEFPLPKAVAKLFVCPNPDCVTNCDPEAETFFWVKGQKEEPSDVSLECAYCQHCFDTAAIISALDHQSIR
ncbi:MAG: hypothetical protein A2951_00500 [Candidatus Buchananbacteria bacterium RIFCSPLOWO2_01_FULL_56_15]|uniref:Uncharacterized protein n=2 Tax=Candidatus Buchananiibacteriota TaxID=1817903 RepID=A0A1G1YLE5_9BACT|nr:MAG: hypothetical protein A3J59_01980 [Candidatus Buchananbacteria bacterium RIFCSPHIGHO2_02_FULL_56_16]OGY54910.1 MAG: hypothetical protein A2951_00500 [Candidatus Buchananbacteria bacterium RIFCSPLOWO2_01_FULL_56_15]